MDKVNNEKLLKIRNSLEGIISQDQTEMVEETNEKQVLKEQKPKRTLLRANEQIER